MVAFESFEMTKTYFDEVVSRYNNFVQQQQQLQSVGSSNFMNPVTINTAIESKSTHSSPSSHSPASNQVSPTTKSTTTTPSTTPMVNNPNDSSINISSHTHEVQTGQKQLQAVFQAADEKNHPPVGILRAQQYESIASNMNILNTPDNRKSSIGYDSTRDLSQNQTNNDSDEAINILNIFVRDYEQKSDDETLAKRFHVFVTSKRDLLRSKKIRRITFSVASKRQQPSYFTFRARDDYKEDRIYRHLEPALAFQLEIYRLRSFALELIPTSNLKIHLYLGKARVAKGVEVTDYRFFARCIIRHSDLITKEASYEYLQSEAERTLLEALNELECSFSHPLASKTDCNHIYMCFVPCVCIDPIKVEESVRSMVLRLVLII